MSKLKIYKASAGSGKTYQLTLEYLRLLFKSASNYKSILAVTFTNKATEEMKSRILKELYLLAKGEKNDYGNILENEFELNKTELKQKAGFILSKILHDFSRFSVTTIDSFFQSVIKSFALETGLRTGFNVELDNTKVLGEVIDRILIDLDQNEKLRNWLLDFAEEKIREGKSWNFKSDISRLGSEIFKEEFQSFNNELILKIADKDFMKKYRQELNKIKVEFENYLQKTGKEALNLMSTYNLEIQDITYGKAGIAGYFNKLANRTDFEPTTRPRQAINDIDKWYKKKSTRIEDIKTAFDAGLNKILENAVMYYDKNFIEYNTADKILAFLYTLGILSDISAKIVEYTQEKNLFLLSDASKLLKEIISDNETPFIYEKTGNRFKHFMIDEFQDTSGMQWGNFKPLIENSLAENNTSLVVGDVKQSIYRWRNSDWKLLSEHIEKDFEHQGFETITLQYNWRSFKNIIDFNNSLFSNASELLTRVLESTLPENEKIRTSLSDLLKKLSNAYSDTYQHPSSNKEATEGYIKSYFLDNEGENDWEEEALHKIPKIVEQLQDKNYQLKDIAILVRNKFQGTEIANTLLEYKNSEAANVKYRYDVISNESLFVNSSPSVRLLIFTLRYYTDTKDMINMAALIHEYHKIKGTTLNQEELHDMFSVVNRECIDDSFSRLPECIRLESDNIKRMPLYELIERLTGLYELNKHHDELPYIQAFLDLVANFSRNDISDTNSFLNWWDEEGHQKAISISEQQDAIRILTIHKSKGLEFKAVILPFCNWNLDHNTTHVNILWCKPNKEPFNMLELVPVKYSGSLSNSLFYREYFLEKMQAFVDNLNLLYVGCTRAKEALYTISPKPQDVKDKKISNIADVMHHLFSTPCQESSDKQKPIVDLSNFWKSNEQFLEIGKLRASNEEIKIRDNELKMSHYPSSLLKDQLKLKKQSNGFFSERYEEIKQRINYGTISHQILEHIHTSEDVEKAVRKAVSDGKISGKEEKDIITRIKSYISQEKVKDWFSGEWQVRTEAGILMSDGKVKRPDRVLIKGDKAIVIDYKFVKDVKESHEEQVQDYLICLRLMDYYDVEGYVWYPDLKEVVEV